MWAPVVGIVAAALGTIAESDRTVRDASHTAVVPADINGEHREFTVTTAHRCGHAARASGIVRDEATPPALPDQPREPARILIVHDHAAVPHERRTAGIEAGQRLAGVCGLRLAVPRSAPDLIQLIAGLGADCLSKMCQFGIGAIRCGVLLRLKVAAE